MPTSRSNGFRVALIAVGGGHVARDTPADVLYGPDSRVVNPPARTTKNLRLEGTIAETRPGLTVIGGGAADVNRPTSLFPVLFDNGVTYLVRCSGLSLYYLRELAGPWEAIPVTGGGIGTFGLLEESYWTATLGPRGPDGTAPNQLFMSNGEDEIIRWSGGIDPHGPIGATKLAGVGRPKGAKVLVAFLDRLFAMNVIDSDNGSRYGLRVQWSTTANPDDWVGDGAGQTLLDDDPYPIANAAVVSGRLVLLKGNFAGGAIYVGTPTGDINNPIRWDAVNPGTGIGILVPKSMSVTNFGLMHFIGHDAIYSFDGVRNLQPIAVNNTRDIIERLNRDALYAGFTWYDPARYEVHWALAMGASTVPNETWVYNVRERRLFGPYEFAGNIVSGASYTTRASYMTWGEITGTWASYAPDPPTRTWTYFDGARLAPVTVLGSGANGNVYQQTGTTDNGTAIAWTYLSGEMTPEARTLRGNVEMELSDSMVLRDVTLRLRDDAAVTPVVEVIGNGTTSNISDALPVGSGTGQIVSKHYHGAVPGSRIQVQVSGTGKVAIHSIINELTPAGSERHG